jgi:hypothetical protein
LAVAITEREPLASKSVVKAQEKKGDLEGEEFGNVVLKETNAFFNGHVFPRSETSGQTELQPLS